jgi:hypothetical protein
MPNNEKNKILLLCKDSNNDLKNVYDRCRSQVLSKKIFNIWNNGIEFTEEKHGSSTYKFFKINKHLSFLRYKYITIKENSYVDFRKEQISIMYEDKNFYNLKYRIAQVTHKNMLKNVKRSLFYYNHNITHFKKSFKESLKASKEYDKKIKEDEEKYKLAQEEREKTHLNERLRHQQRINNLIYGF